MTDQHVEQLERRLRKLGMFTALCGAAALSVLSIYQYQRAEFWEGEAKRCGASATFSQQQSKQALEKVVQMESEVARLEKASRSMNAAAMRHERNAIDCMGAVKGWIASR